MVLPRQYASIAGDIRRQAQAHFRNAGPIVVRVGVEALGVVGVIVRDRGVKVKGGFPEAFVSDGIGIVAQVELDVAAVVCCHRGRNSDHVAGGVPSLDGEVDPVAAGISGIGVAALRGREMAVTQEIRKSLAL